MIQSDPENRFVLQADLGQDRIVYRFFERRNGTVDAGADTVCFASLGRWAEALHLSHQPALDVFHSGRSIHAGLLSLRLRNWFAHSATDNFHAASWIHRHQLLLREILVSSDGKFLYAANRLHNSIAAFAIAADGRLHYLGETWTEGDYPSNMSIGPGGRFLYVSGKAIRSRRFVSTSGQGC